MTLSPLTCQDGTAVSVGGLSPGPGTDLHGETRTCVTMELGDLALALDVATVREILDFRPVTPLPNAPADLLGMIDLRGESIAVIDLTARLGLSGRNVDPGRIIVLDLDDGRGGPIGMIADRVLSVIEVPHDTMEPAPETRLGWSSTGMLGVLRIGGRQTILLDPARILGEETDHGFFLG